MPQFPCLLVQIALHLRKLNLITIGALLKIDFVKSAVNKADYPKGRIKEIAIVGRSNSGKSSFINALSGNKKTAKTSNKPGKTRLLNFFLVNEAYHLVDMPGYGFASRGGFEVKQW